MLKMDKDMKMTIFAGDTGGFVVRIKKDGEPEKTEAQSVDAFIAKLRQMSEKEAAKDAQNKDNKEQPDYSKYVARHARKVEAQKQRDDEGR